jgi:hypothetical protein
MRYFFKCPEYSHNPSYPFWKNGSNSGIFPQPVEILRWVTKAEEYPVCILPALSECLLPGKKRDAEGEI